MRWRSSAVALFAVAFSACHASPQVRLKPDATSGADATSRADATSVPGTASGALQHDIDALVHDPALARSTWGIVARSLRTNETFYSLNPHTLLIPASAMKLVTVAAAVERLGWDFTFRTRLVATGTIGDGVLHGDLVVVGSGDPSIVERDGMASRLFDGWADQLKAAGITAIDGRIVGDGRVFDDPPLGFGWSWDDLAAGFAAGISGLQYNENRVDVTVAPGATLGAPAEVAPVSAASGLLVTNHVTTGTQRRIAVHRFPGGSRLELRGVVPLNGAPSTLSVSVDRPAQFFVSALRDALVARGIDVRGRAVDIDEISDAPSLAGGMTVVDYPSPPLSALLVAPMKFSVNLYEETLLKTLGAWAGAPNAASGRSAARAVLEQWGIPSGDVIQMDGSGLSRYDYATADALAAVLAHVDRDDRLRGPFEALLPVAGRDGTLAGRFRGSPLEGRMRAKTGSMANVRSLAGYATTAGGESIVFAIIVNGFDAPSDIVSHTIDSIVLRLTQ